MLEKNEYYFLFAIAKMQNTNVSELQAVLDYSEDEIEQKLNWLAEMGFISYIDEEYFSLSQKGTEFLENANFNEHINKEGKIACSDIWKIVNERKNYYLAGFFISLLIGLLCKVLGSNIKEFDIITLISCSFIFGFLLHLFIKEPERVKKEGRGVILTKEGLTHLGLTFVSIIILGVIFTSVNPVRPETTSPIIKQELQITEQGLEIKGEGKKKIIKWSEISSVGSTQENIIIILSTGENVLFIPKKSIDDLDSFIEPFKSNGVKVKE